MFNNSSGQAVYCDGPMTKSAKEGDTATTSGCSLTTTTTSSCSSSLIALLGDGCHYMYNDSAGNQIYCDGPMTKSAKAGDTVTIQGCSSYTTTTTTTTTTSSCSSSLIALLGTGCHYMYSGLGDGRGPIYCNTEMNKSAREGDTVTTTGCSSSTSTTPSGQKEQIWNVLGLRSWIRTDADATRIDSLKQACANVPSGANVWLPGSGDSTSVDFGMPSADKCRLAAACASGQYFDGASCVTTTTTGGTVPVAPTNLTAVQSQADALLNWYDNSTNENEYKIERRITGSATWTYVGGAGIVYGGSGTYRDYYPPAGSYDYKVRACNSAGCSESNVVLLVISPTSTVAQCSDGRDNDGDGLIDYPSDTGCYSRDDNDEAVSPPVGGGVPLPPSGLTAVVAANGYDLILRWNDNSTNESEYKIWRRLGTSWSFLVSIGIAYGGTVTHTDLSMPAGYTGVIDYKVQACNSSGCSPDSNTASVTVVGTPPQPTGCDSALIALLGQGCHYMYNDYSANPVFCNGNMTISAKRGDTAITQGCQYGGPPVPTTFSVDPYSTYPKDQESGVNTLMRIRVNFTREIDLASTISQFFSLALASSPSAVLNGTFQFFGNGFEFVPASPLNSNTTYIYKVFTTLKDKSGTNLSAPLTRTFTTVGGVSANATIEGTVLDAADKILSGVSINVYKENFTSNISAVSAADGSFRVIVSAGNYWIEAYPPSGRADLLRPNPIKVSVVSGAIEKVTVKFNTVSTAAKAVTGSVKFSSGGAVTDAEVGAFSLETYQWVSTSPDATGNYTLRVTGGKWTVGVRPKNPATASWSYSGPFPEVSFTKDSASDLQIVNFLIPSADATLNVKTVDAQDKPLSGVGVVVDTISAGGSESSSIVENRSSPKFRTSDANGVAKFNLVSGRYHVRGFLPSEKGYLNSPEQEVTAVGSKIVEISMVFLKRNAVITIPFKGIIKLEDGIPTDAFIWAWSEKGGYLSTFSAASGLFEFKVGQNERWHIGAGKVVNNIPYKAPEVVVDVKEVGVNVELILVKLDKDALPPPVVIKESTTKQIVAQTEDGAKAVVPPNAAGSSGNISVEVKPTVEAPSQAAAQVVGTVYDVSIRDSAGKDITTLNSDVEIIIPYDEAELKSKGVDEDGVIPSFFDEKTGTWVKVDNYTIDKEKNIVILRVKHLTRFSLVAPADTTPPAPPTKAVASALGEGKVKVSWQNPVSDFAYAKVYRSDKLGELGKLVAPQLKGSQYIDGSIADGVTYYYAVRSVDPAGNESNNQDQVNVKAIGTSAQVSAPVKPASAAVSVKKGGLSRNLSQGAKGDDVKTLQELLIKEGFLSAGSSTGFFGNLTKQAVIRFQEKYASEVLTPVGLTKGSGFVGTGTRKKINELLAK
ncbi:MAG: Ig-like domain-containing protein [Candidatus Sungiibacteriota bacterium]|uniref:Ig-like domain-containing protein n=1 Tax=Candidatus Sungiibacteriota bacterium TaxID=2750080 RepID=A0A7T5RJ92_9BACT|nr:MAG: Ig-like domain-containing protein [Candidatus Sungbacteria bacterium]